MTIAVWIIAVGVCLLVVIVLTLLVALGALADDLTRFVDWCRQEHDG